MTGLPRHYLASLNPVWHQIILVKAIPGRDDHSFDLSITGKTFLQFLPSAGQS
jgi:hypothetical protein